MNCYQHQKKNWINKITERRSKVHCMVSDEM